MASMVFCKIPVATTTRLMTTKPEKRFQVGFSPGIIAQVAEYLANRLGKEQVIYDQYYEAEILRLNMDTYRQNIYHYD